MVENQKSASSGQSVPITRKIDEATRQFFKLVQQRNPFRRRDYPGLTRDLAEYRELAQQYAGMELDSAQIFELGCGQRPYRLFYLIANGLRASAVDLDRVVFSMGLSDIKASLQDNGLERTAKTTLRYLIFDVSENRHFRRLLSDIQGHQFDWPLDAIRLGDATKASAWPDNAVDFIYSEDVFEHIPRETISQLCEQMAQRLSDKGIAVIRPMIFTGIQGGHNVEYYNLDPSKSRNCPPWDHLRDHKFPSNTFLNEMTRADYRDLFSEYFEILDETVRDPERGRAFMTDEIRHTLADWSDEELFSNHVRFVLKPRRS